MKASDFQGVIRGVETVAIADPLLDGFEMADVRLVVYEKPRTEGWKG